MGDNICVELKRFPLRQTVEAKKQRLQKGTFSCFETLHV